MSDPITTPLMVKTLSGVGGLVGGVSFMAFYRPKNVWDAAVRSGLSTTAAIVFAPIICDILEKPHSLDNMIAISVALGFSAWSILSLVARFLINIQDEKTNIKLPSFIEKK
jgi:hypothetical protein